jgi:hypothetical protein
VGAYLLGARAGRERYDQIVEKVRDLSASARDRAAGEDPSWEPSTPSSAGASAAAPGRASGT